MALPNRTITSQALVAIENNDIEHIRQLLASPGGLELEKAGELVVTALELDRTEIAIDLIEHKINFNATNDEGSTCLMIAAKRNNLVCLEKILERQQISINSTDLFNWTALMYSCYYGHSEVTRCLLLAGAHADVYDNDQMSCLIWAAGRGHVDCVSRLIQIGRAKVNQVDKCGTSPLIWACRKGFTEVARVLLKSGANVDSTGMFGWSALLVSVHGNHVETLKLLLQHKPNVNTCDAQRHTPLIAASKDGRLEIVRLLLKSRAFVNLSDEYGHTALIHAARGAHLEVVDLLLKHHADIDHSGVDRKTALFWAVEKGNASIVERLIQGKANLELTSKEGETCLMKAVKLRKVAIVRLLLSHQAKAGAVDKNGDTILHMAVKMQSATLAQLILSNPRYHNLLHKANKTKRTPIMLDAENPSPVFPTLLAMLNATKTPSKLIDKTFTSINFHIDNSQLEYGQPTGEENLSSSSSSLVKKLASALNHPPQSYPQVLV